MEIHKYTYRLSSYDVHENVSFFCLIDDYYFSIHSFLLILIVRLIHSLSILKYTFPVSCYRDSLPKSNKRDALTKSTTKSKQSLEW
jgi:hypothetical protein